jgi:hypothetical protein
MATKEINDVMDGNERNNIYMCDEKLEIDGNEGNSYFLMATRELV